MKNIYIYIAFFCILFLTSCAVYTEKRSQALSRAVAATADSIQVARFDLASKYSKEAEKIAYPPKERIDIKPIITKDTSYVNIENKKTEVDVSGKKTLLDSNVLKIKNKKEDEKTVIRLVVPEHLRHAKLLIENSDEWNELMKSKNFADQLEKDNLNLKKLASEIEGELNKQLRMNNKMIEDLNKLQKQVLQKNLHILKLYIVIALLTVSIAGGIYLRMKGVL
jgi:hypothetical protein